MSIKITHLSTDDIFHIFNSRNYNELIKANPFVRSIPFNTLVDSDITRVKSCNKQLWKTHSSANKFGFKHLETLSYIRPKENFTVIAISDPVFGRGYALRDKDSYLVSSRFMGEFLISPRSNHITVAFFSGGHNTNVTFSRSFKLLINNVEATILKVINYCSNFDYHKYIFDKENSKIDKQKTMYQSASTEQLTLNIIKTNRLALGGESISEFIHSKINKLIYKAKSESYLPDRIELNKQIKSLKNNYDLVLLSAIESVQSRRPEKFKFKREYSSLYKGIQLLVNDNHKYEYMTYIGLDYRFGIKSKNNTKNHIV